MKTFVLERSYAYILMIHEDALFSELESNLSILEWGIWETDFGTRF